MNYDINYGAFHARLTINTHKPNNGAYEARIEPLSGNPSILLESWMGAPSMVPQLFELNEQECADALALHDAIQEYKGRMYEEWYKGCSNEYSDVEPRTAWVMALLKEIGVQEPATFTVEIEPFFRIGVFQYDPSNGYVDDLNYPQMTLTTTRPIEYPWIVMHDHLPYVSPFFHQWYILYQEWGDLLKKEFSMNWMKPCPEWKELRQWLDTPENSLAHEEVMLW